MNPKAVLALLLLLLVHANPVLEKRLTVVNAKNSANGDCYIHKMASGESCAYLIEKFSNVKTTTNLNSWNEDNPTWKGCSTSTPYVGDKVCVSDGNFPDYSPSPYSNGTCYTHYVKSGDTCTALGSSYPISASRIESFNTKTYGWLGCDDLQIGQAICLGSGNPPKPTPNPDAVCGPLAPGDLYNTTCPLNACCSDYGYCGTTSDYCDTKTSTTGAPGTSGCYTNCGYGVLDTTPASTFKNIVYWMDRDDGLASDPADLSSYSHIYYAFASINSDYSIDVDFPTSFLDASPRKIVSFGGADFSSSTSTYKIFRNIVSTAANRETFATNAVNLINKYGLAGIDIDWEYPGEQDISGIPAGSSTEGEGFYELLKVIKGKLTSSQVLSITIPASYYYLQAFPIAEMQSYVNWFVFMTYDYHGSWETGLEAIVRCHVNLTETTSALKMLKKAGVKSYKIMGGIATYGRTFKLSSTSCYGVGCKVSGAGAEGSTSQEAGFLTDFEINALASSSSKVRRWSDSAANCDFMQYDTNSVVGWNKAGERTSNIDFFKQAGCGGSVTWAANYLS